MHFNGHYFSKSATWVITYVYQMKGLQSSNYRCNSLMLFINVTVTLSYSPPRHYFQKELAISTGFR